MSDNTRESFTGKASSTLKPEQQKTGTEQAGNTLRGKADSAASTVQPDSHKSATQKVSDTLSQAGSGDKSMTDKAKDTVGLGNK